MKNLELTALKGIKSLDNKLRICFADTESMSKTDSSFRCGAIAYLSRNKETIKFFTSLKEFGTYIFSNFDVCYFYNITYDSNYIRNYVFENTNYQEFEISSGNRMLGLVYSDKENEDFKVMIKDIFPFCLSSLEKACNSFEIDLKKYDVDFDKCSLDEIRKHNEVDSLMLLRLAYCMRNTLFEMFHVDLFHEKIYSAPSLAIKIYRTNFITKPILNPYFLQKCQKGMKPITEIRKDLFEFSEMAYKGGFCNAENTSRFENVYSFDISSSYPFAITAIRFPMGMARYTTSFDLWKISAMQIPSIALVKVELNIPLICGVRNGKLVKLCGVFEECLTSFEIFSVIRYGGKILSFIKGLIFTEWDKTNSFAKYERETYKIKSNSKGAKKMLGKLLCNTPYGKFAQDYIQLSKHIEYCRTRDEFEEKSYVDGIIRTIDLADKGGLIITESENESPKPYMIKIWGCLICGFARLYLMEQAIRTNSIYEDTDSIKVLESNLHLVQSVKPKNVNWKKQHYLGFWECEGKYKEFRAIAPKMYAYLDENNEKHVVCKGVIKSERDKLYDKIMNGLDEISTDKFIKIMNPSESLIAQTYISKSGVFGGVRECQKTLKPKPKEIFRGEM